VRVPSTRRRQGDIRYISRTFNELEEESNAVACYFQRCGVGRGAKVLLMVKPGLELILSTFALFKIGAVPVLIDPGMGLKHFLTCVERNQPSALVGIPVAHWLSRLFCKKFQSISVRVPIGNRAYRQGVAACSGQPFTIADTQQDELAAILFTSGSTGPPKGVEYQHGMFEAQVELIRQQFCIQPEEVDLPMLPIFALFNPAMGMTTVVPEMNPGKPATVDPARIVQAIQQNGVTNSFGSPVLWTKIGRYCREHAITLPSIRRLLIAGAPVSPELMRMFKQIIPNGEIYSPYGATEALPIASISSESVLNKTWSKTEQGMGTCVGQLLPNIQVKIIQITDEVIDAWRADLELPAGQIGEIIVKGPVVTQAYHGLAAATAHAKIREGDRYWHRMGDLGYIDAAGWLWFCGRKAERVQLADGTTLYTDCCEGIVNQHKHVFRSALIGLGQPGQHIPALVIEPEKPVRSSPDALLKSVRTHTARFAMLSGIEHYFIHPDFPVDVRHNAKIHRLTLKRLFEKKVLLT